MTRHPLPLLSGLLLVLSLPPFPTTPLPFVALVPLGVHLARQPADANREAWRAGAVTGAVLFALLLHWIPFALAPAWVGAPAWVAVTGVLAFFPALAAGAAHHARGRLRVPLWLALAVSWTGAEWMRASLPGGLAFPWLGTAAALAGFPEALGLAEWVGERGVTFWIVLANGLAAEAVVRLLSGAPGRPSPAAFAGAVAALVVAPVVVGAGRADRIAAGPTVRIAVMRTMLERTGREEPVRAADEMEAVLARLLPTLAPGSADLVLLPETAFPILLDEPRAGPRVERLRAHAARLGTPLAVGGFALAGDGVGVHNAVFVVDGLGVRGRYHKRRLVPGVERTPLVPSRFLADIGDDLAYAVGEARPPPDAGGLLLGPLVCFESAFGALALAQQRDGARLLVNLTNDGWFGRWAGAARAQHEAHLVLRAVEGRIGVARSANVGRALVVDPAGRVTAATGRGESIEVLEVPTRGALTLFVRWGDVVGPLTGSLLLVSLLTGVGFAARPRSPRGRRARGEPSPGPERPPWDGVGRERAPGPTSR